MAEMILLFLEFFKTGLFAVGGGLATLPFLYEMAEKYDWFTTQMVGDMIAISESTPGPIGVNMATYVGFQNIGLLGGISTTIGLITPSIIIILIISKFLIKFKESKKVKEVFYILRPMATGLIASAGISVIVLALFGVKIENMGNAVLNIKTILLFIAMYIFIKKTKFHPVVAIAISGIIGILLGF